MSSSFDNCATTYWDYQQSPHSNSFTALFLGHYFWFHHLAAQMCTFQSQRRVTLPDSFQSHAVLQATTAGGSSLNISTSQLFLGLTVYCCSLAVSPRSHPRLLPPAVVACSTVWEWECRDNASDER